MLPPAGDVHVWALDLDRSPGAIGGLLSSDELRRAERRGPRWAASRAGLRALLAAYLDADAAALAFDERGKPRLDPASPLRFNLSHSGDAALIAVATEREVGVDLERVGAGRDVAAIGRRVLVSSERAAVSEAADPVLAFHCHWSAKEAFVKATGRGVASMRSLELALDAPGGPRLVQVGGDPDEAARWSLHLLEVAKPYVAALVVEGSARIAPLAVFEPGAGGPPAGRGP